MKIYKIKKFEVVETECKNFMFLAEDNDGDTIYENTHFMTKEEAYNQAIAECNAGMSLATNDIISCKKGLERLKNELAEYAIAKQRLEKERMKLVWKLKEALL